MDLAPHNVILENREHLSVSGVSEVISFDENQVSLVTSMGILTVGGQQLHVEKLNLEMGEISIAGQIEAMVYEEEQLRRRGFWSRLF
ncbi:sporulation protein YabP [Intestinimonas butyriciproducens]|uniref:sporulation protein YabP n=1 Tax=Intestinimonas butyriciproducens TaxID=1297617 RepID=UPI001FB0399A|nr:sporulation protein YabP [Intestinimonas butyriciproducens]